MLLTYLVQNRGKPCLPDELYSVLNFNKRSSNPANALKTCVCRTRQFLETLSPGLGRAIHFQFGSYLWNASFDTVTDLEQFDRLILKAEDHSQSAADRLTACLRAITLYKSGLPGMYEKNTWFHTMNLHYHDKYIETTHKALSLLEQFQRYDQIVKVCHIVLPQEPCNETVHRALIRSLYKLGKIDEARDCYYQAMNLFYQEYSIAPSNAFHDLYLLLMDGDTYHTKDIGTLATQLAEEDKQPGAYYCEYAVFKTIYQAAYRASLRTGSFPCLCLFTVKERPSLPPNPRQLTRTLEQLGDKIRHYLRTGDVYTRVGPLQYAVLFSQSTFEGGCIAARRIIRQTTKSYPARAVEIVFSIQTEEERSGTG